MSAKRFPWMRHTFLDTSWCHFHMQNTKHLQKDANASKFLLILVSNSLPCNISFGTQNPYGTQRFWFHRKLSQFCKILPKMQHGPQSLTLKLCWSQSIMPPSEANGYHRLVLSISQAPGSQASKTRDLTPILGPLDISFFFFKFYFYLHYIYFSAVIHDNFIVSKMLNIFTHCHPRRLLFRMLKHFMGDLECSKLKA